METGKRAEFPLVTAIIAAVNVTVFLISDLILYQKQDMIAFYMALNPFLVLEKNEYWRIVTSMFYHFGIEHLMSNMFMLLVLGTLLEPFFGRVRYAVLYFASGIIASGVSILYNTLVLRESGSLVFCAGASGAIYGLIGAFVAIFIFRGKQLSVQEKSRMVFAVFFLLFGGLFEKGVGHDAHFGGFFAGILLGSVYCFLLKRKVFSDKQK
ncbi:MAG: rhomboid family intramembrane serine protease [Lachnospiraceae bacterium]|nr:rhomboid family intramembrane serine protease [Lachnospiraceae bacterium]